MQEEDPKFSEQNLQINKKQLLTILKQSPVAGVYQGQDPNKWHQFFNFYIKFLKSEIGPRGQCSKAVRQQLSKKPQFYDQILSILKCTHKTHIKDIYVKYKLFSPCLQYQELIKTKQCYEKSHESEESIKDESSIMYAKIKQGMLNKRGPDYNYKQQIEVIRQKYKQKNQMLAQKIKDLQQKLQKIENYRRYLTIKKEMKPFFDMWRQADKKVGFESIEKGDTFEKIVCTHLLPLLLKRSKIDPNSKYKVQTNNRWSPKALGQIDITIITFNQIENIWEASVLIQCKSRLFDIRQAFKQVNNLKQKGKQKLCTSMGILGLSPNIQSFIVTTLPQNQFQLPIESKLKQKLEKAAKNVPVDEIKSQDIFPVVKQAFQQELSPLDWLLANDSQRIIVLKY